MRLAPRFSLRALLLAVIVIAVSIPASQALWRRHVLRQDAAHHAAMLAIKQDFIESQAEEARSRVKEGNVSITNVIDDGRPIPDDFAVLVRKGNVFGCFIPRKQHRTAESLEYDWYYREDGKGGFDTDHPKVRKGRSKSRAWVSNGPWVTVDFGPFSIPWSGNGPGWGFLYYDYSNDHDLNNVVAICATDRKSVEQLDARDGQWVYKAYVGHEGVPGDVKVEPIKHRLR